MVFFLTHVEPLHPLHGKEALFFIREQSEQGNKSHVIVKEIPHYFFTPTMLPEDAHYTLEQLEQERLLQHLSITQQAYSGNKHFLRAEGSKEDRLILPPPFLCSKNEREKWERDPLGLNSPARLLRWLYPTTMLLLSADPEDIPLPDDIFSSKYRATYASLDNLLQDTATAFDIEVRGWQSGHDYIYMAVYICPEKQQQVLFHYFDFPDQEYQEFRLQRFSSQKEFGKLITAQVQADDPLWEFGHNLMNYDRIKVRELTEQYFPATNKHYPITKSAQGLGRVITKGRLTVDTYTYMFNYLNIFANNKLETLAEFKKSASYAEMDSLEQQARRGNKDAFYALLDYCREDGLKTMKAGRELQQRVALKARHFRRDADSICATGKLTIAKEYWDRRHFLIKKTFSHGWKRRRAEHEEELVSLEHLKDRLLKASFTPGFFEDARVVYFTPFIAGAHALLRRRSPELLEIIEKSKNPLEQFDCRQTLNAELSFLVEETARILHGVRWDELSLRERYPFIARQFLNPPEELTEKQHAALYCLFQYHGIKSITPLDFIREAHAMIMQGNKALLSSEILNRGGYFYLLGKGNQLGDTAYSLGRGPALSLDRGSFIANPFYGSNRGSFVYQGFSAESGGKTNFEKRLLQEVVQQIFSGAAFGEISCSLRQEIAEFSAGKNPEDDYFVEQKTRIYYRNLLEDILEQRSLNGTIPLQAGAAYQRIKHRIDDRFSGEVQKELQLVVAQCRQDFSYPFIEEVVEMLYHPYPPKIELVYATGYRGELLPASLAHGLELDTYKVKAQKQFKRFFGVLERKQLQLPF